MAQPDPDHQPDRAAAAPGASDAPRASSSTPQSPYLTGTPALPGATGARRHGWSADSVACSRGFPRGWSAVLAGCSWGSARGWRNHVAGRSRAPDMTDPPAPPGAAGTPHEAGATTSPGTAGAPHVTGAPTSQGAVGVDPLTAPLTYPGTPPWRPAVLVTDAAVLALQPRHDAPLAQWLVQTDDVGASLGPISRGRLHPGTTPGDLASPDTFTGETQSRGLTPGRRDAFKAKADNAEANRAMAGNAEPHDAEADRARPDRGEPDRRASPTARVRVVRIRMVLTPLTCRDLPSTATCRTPAAHRWRRLYRCSRSVRTPPQLSCGGSWPTLACPYWCRLPR